MMKHDMYLVTKEFPYGHGEESFVKPEYPYLCDKFNVFVITSELGDEKSYIQENEIKSCIIPKTQGFFDKIVSLLLFLCKKECYAEMKSIVRSRRKVLQQLYRAIMFGTAAETFYRRVKEKIALNKNTEAIFYFYWFDYKCLGMTMNKHKYPKIKIMARTHGYDLYDFRELYGRQFFKPQMDAKLEKLVFAAQFAKDYYLQRYQKQDCGKYPLHRLGVADKYVTLEMRRDLFEDEFVLLSCSNVIAIKRVELIIDGLSEISDKRVKWIHIGNGIQLEALKEKAKVKLGGKNNIQYEFTGYMVNDSIMKLYRDRYVSCFITVTSTEGGSPVSVQEALSFGVPIIATSVGELPQMVMGNGILLSENPTAMEISNSIEKMKNLYGTEQYFQMCGQSLRIYKDMFCSAHNYMRLAEELAGFAKDRNYEWQRKDNEGA